MHAFKLSSSDEISISLGIRPYNDTRSTNATWTSFCSRRAYTFIVNDTDVVMYLILLAHLFQSFLLAHPIILSATNHIPCFSQLLLDIITRLLSVIQLL